MRTLTILALALAMTACGHRPPTLRVIDAIGPTRGNDGVQVVFVVEATNPNDHAVPFRLAEYTLAVEGTTGTRVQRHPKVTAPPNSTAVFELPASVALDEPLGTRPYRLSGRVVYERPGELAEILFDARWVVPRTGLRDRGTLSDVPPPDPS